MPYSNPGGLIAAAVVVQIIVLAVLVLRFVSRGKLPQHHTVSDWLIIPPGILSTGLVVLQVYGAATGVLGNPLAPRLKEHPERMTELKLVYRRYEIASMVVSLVTSGLIKISISFFLLRIFSVAKYRRVIIPWIVILIIWTVGFMIPHLALCGRHGTMGDPKFIDPVNVKKYCGNGVALGQGLVISSVITDLVTMLLPLPMVMSLQMKLSQKVVLMGIFMIGFISVGASVARAHTYITGSLHRSTIDYSIAMTAICVWNLVEVQMGLIAACAPTLRPVWNDVVASHIFSRLRSSANSIFSRTAGQSSASFPEETNKSNRTHSMGDSMVESEAATISRGKGDSEGIHVFTEVKIDIEDDEKFGRY